MKIICGEKSYQAEEIIEQYSTMLFRLAMARMKNKEDAQDIVQDAFLKMLLYVKKGKKFNDEEHLKAWLLTVVINRGKSILSMIWNKKTEGMDGIKEMAAPEEKTDYAYEYVMRLPENYRIAINLFYYEQFTTEQIADVMGAKPATVRSYLHRGRSKLKEMMEADNYVE